MESHLAANTQDSLIQGLSYSLPNAAEYILARTNVTYFPQGGNSYAPTGVRLIRFQLADNTQFLDPHSIRLMFTLTNGDAARPLQLTGPPMVLFQRARLVQRSGRGRHHVRKPHVHDAQRHEPAAPQRLEHP